MKLKPVKEMDHMDHDTLWHTFTEPQAINAAALMDPRICTP